MFISTYIQKENYPSILNLNKAIKAADMDALNRNSRDLYSIIRKISIIDPKVRGLINTRKTGLLAYDSRLESKDKTIDVLPYEMRTKSNIKRLKELTIHNALFGSALAKIEKTFVNGIWKIDLIQIDNADFEAIDFETFKVYNSDNTMTTYNYAEVKKEFVYLFDGNYERGGLLRSILFYVILKNETFKIWSEFNKNSRGVVVSQYDLQKLDNAQRLTGDNSIIKEAVENLDKTMQNLGEKGYIKTPDGINIELAKMTDGVANISFKNIIAEFDAAISIAIVGTANTSELPNNGGSRAALQVLSMIKADIIYNDMNDAKTLIDDFLLQEYQLNNNSAAGFINYEFEWVYDDVADIVANATMFQIISQIGMPIQIKTKEFYNKLNLDMPDGLSELMSLGNANTII